MRILTYSLRLAAPDSDGYYRAVATLADDWLPEAQRQAGPVSAGLRAYRHQHGLLNGSDGELAFELLVLGVMLQKHARSLDNLAEWVKQNPEDARAGRLAQWLEYVHNACSAEYAYEIARLSLALEEDFDRSSQVLLGEYTAGVPRFLDELPSNWPTREDAELISRSRLEYHLGMLGTEILNRAFRPRFLAARRKVVIVPPCMRAQPEEDCKAVATPFGAKCQACTPTCRVHQVTRMGAKHGFEVYMIPDDLRVFGAGSQPGDLGVVGVSCALTNWSGGWQAEAIGVPAQGVLLDYVGCKYHWDAQGFPTDTNLRKLSAVVGVSPTRRG